MEFQDLVKLGFNRNEAIVYLALVKFRRADANILIRETKFHKNIVYDNLDKLIDKGLAGYVIENKRKVFSMAGPNMLIEFFDEQMNEIKGKKEEAIKIAKEISRFEEKKKPVQQAIVYRGIKGIKLFYNQTLEMDADYVVFGAPGNSVSIMGELFWANYNAKRVKRKMNVRMIFNRSIRGYGKEIENAYTHIRYFDKDFEPMSETHVQKDMVAVIVWTDEPYVFVIQDAAVARSYRRFFEDMWNVAKR